MDMTNFSSAIESNYIGRFAFLSKYVGQGACLLDDEHALFYAQESGTDRGLVDIADLKNKKTTRKGTNFTWGHGNSITTDGKYLYVVPMSHYEGSHYYLKVIYQVDIQTLKTIKTHTLPFNVYSCSYDKKTKNFYVCQLGAPHKIYKWDPTTNETKLLFTLQRPFGITRLQGIVVNNNIVHVLYFDPNVIGIYDLQGNILSYVQLSSKIGFMEAQELEAIDFASDGTCYIFSDGYYNGGTYKYNIVGAIDLNKSNIYNIQDNLGSYAYPVTSKVSSKCNVYTTFYADGTAENPFPTIQEGIMHHINNPWSRAVELDKGTYSEDVRVTKKYAGYLQIEATGAERVTWKGKLDIWCGDAICRRIDFIKSGDFCIKLHDFGILHLDGCTYNCGSHAAIEAHGPIYLRGSFANKGKGPVFHMMHPAPVYAGDSMQLKKNDFKWEYSTSQVWLPKTTIQRG